MTRQIVSTDKAPSAIGAYSQAVRAGDTVYLSGAIPLVPETMELVSTDVRTQIVQVFDNLEAVCTAAGGSFEQVVKLNVYLTDLSDFPLVNEVMAERFSEPYPARAAVEVSALPRGVSVEVEGVMYLG
ncbi:RidA family protein [Granulosicoccus antarcticus]|uniref:2-iminobutanoate/2-iminopropanoate deaminase n=1 Tax=Granulosicoccus antarcticus IMCC3135 TaxID=1192854 RepID=A0A2Z2NYY7_9GAMM|nr:RidA family protein [Granulosicoccus antarcticus]ASJ76666.1 2-iminobutanoate/2-iminopropanoate deaminase [Granulosicoccus antarcticus IMCC3135]